MVPGRVFVGTSGWSYPAWRPLFYPRDARAGELLRHYGARLGSVEVNHTFSRLPTEAVLARWVADVPAGFRFAVKAPRWLSHAGGLAPRAELAANFFERVASLGRHLGPVLFHLPPTLRFEAERLDRFLALLPPERRCAIEARHRSWYVPAVYDALGTRGIALCHAEGEAAPSPLETLSLAPFAYIRLRDRRGYGPARLDRWTARISDLVASGHDVHVFLRHDPQGRSARAAEALWRSLSHARATMR